MHPCLEREESLQPECPEPEVLRSAAYEEATAGVGPSRQVHRAAGEESVRHLGGRDRQREDYADSTVVGLVLEASWWSPTDTNSPCAWFRCTEYASKRSAMEGGRKWMDLSR